MPFLPAGVGAAVAGGVASGAVGLIGSKLAGGAAAGGAAQGQQILQQQLANLQPYVDTGTTATTQQANLLGLNGQDAANAAMSTYQTSPGYQWQLQQGLRGVDAGAAAKGMLRSGATLKAEQTFGQGLADSDFGQYYNRLAGLSTTGESAAAGSAVTADTAGSLAQGAGNTQASIYGNTAGGLGSTVSGLFQNPNVQSLFNGTVGPATVQQNALYQQGAFASQPAGTYGPFA